MRLTYLLMLSVGLLALGALRFGEYLYTLLVAPFLALGLALAYGFANRQRIYVAALLTTHLMFVAFGTWLFGIRRQVAATPLFDFSVFTDANLRTALTTLVLSSLALCVLPMASRSAQGRLAILSPRQIIEGWLSTFSRIDAIAAYGLALISVAVTLLLFFTSATVMDLPYPDHLQGQWHGPQAINLLLGAVIFGTLIAHSRQATGRSSRTLLTVSRMAVLSTSVLLLVLSGGRGIFVFSWILLSAVSFFLGRRIPNGQIWGIFFACLAGGALLLWPSMRVHLSSLTMMSALIEATSALSTTLAPDGTIGSSINIDGIPILNMAFFQLLYAIQLVADGLSLGGSTFLNLIPQALPSFLDGIFWERPPHDSFRLSEYYFHTGGLLVAANAYWNGGLLVTLTYMSLLGGLSHVIDGLYLSKGSGLIFRIGYILALPLFTVTLAYGIQSNARALQLVLMTLVVDWGWRWFKSPRAT